MNATARPPGLLLAAIRLGSLTPFLIPLALLLAAVGGSSGAVHYAGDFHYSFWPAGQRLLHGESPYVDPGSPDIARAIAFVYPAVGALLLAPLALIPRELADALFAGVNLAAVILTLRILGVRDWRLYGVVLACLPVCSGWIVGNVTLLLGLGVAVAWRYRARPMVAGLVVALLVSVKLFLWPLALWLLATRRYAALAWATAGGVALNAIAWAVLGFDELDRYIRLMRALTAAEQDVGYSLVGLLIRGGATHGAAYGLALAAAAGCGLACLTVGRRGSELPAMALAIAVSLLASPIVQVHYFALLIVPLAVARPRLGAAWALPVAMWLCLKPEPWQVAVALSLTAAMVGVVCGSRPAAVARLTLS
jgi:hypothetical protein